MSAERWLLPFLLLIIKLFSGLAERLTIDNKRCEDDLSSHVLSSSSWIGELLPLQEFHPDLGWCSRKTSEDIRESTLITNRPACFGESLNISFVQPVHLASLLVSGEIKFYTRFGYCGSGATATAKSVRVFSSHSDRTWTLLRLIHNMPVQWMMITLISSSSMDACCLKLKLFGCFEGCTNDNDVFRETLSSERKSILPATNDDDIDDVDDTPETDSRTQLTSAPWDNSVGITMGAPLPDPTSTLTVSDTQPSRRMYDAPKATTDPSSKNGSQDLEIFAWVTFMKDIPFILGLTLASSMAFGTLVCAIAYCLNRRKGGGLAARRGSLLDPAKCAPTLPPSDDSIHFELWTGASETLLSHHCAVVGERKGSHDSTLSRQLRSLVAYRMVLPMKKEYSPRPATVPTANRPVSSSTYDAITPRASCYVGAPEPVSEVSSRLYDSIEDSVGSVMDQLADACSDSVLRVDLETLELGDRIGGGQFSHVYRASMWDAGDGSRDSPAGHTTVAVKVITARFDGAVQQDFIKEVIATNQPRHSNLLRLLGVSLKDPLCLVLEYMPNSDLRTYLTSRRPPRSVVACGGKTARCDVKQPVVFPDSLLCFCADIAAGMEHLTSRGFIHRDLATRNCLVGADLRIKVSDFGMSRYLSASNYYQDAGFHTLPVRWMAPESIHSGKFSVSSDVWSFGITAWEVYTFCRLVPHWQMKDEELVAEACQLVSGASNALQPPAQPAECDKTMYNLMLACWNSQPEERPSFSYLRDKVEAMLRGAEPTVWA